MHYYYCLTLRYEGQKAAGILSLMEDYLVRGGGGGGDGGGGGGRNSGGTAIVSEN